MIPIVPQQEAAVSTHRQWVTVPRILLLILALLVVYFVGLKIFINLKIQKLEHMLADVQSLRPGISSRGEAMRIAAKYAGQPGKRLPCSEQTCTLEMHVTWCDPDIGAANALDDWIWSRLGIHCWEGWSWIIVENKVVTATGAQLSVEGAGPQPRWHETDWSLDEVIPQVNVQEEKQFLHNFDPKWDGSPNFLVDWTGPGHTNRREILYARIGTHATAEQRRAAQNFNLKCLTKWGNCSSVCDLLPDATRYYVRGLGGGELPFPYPHCN